MLGWSLRSASRRRCAGRTLCAAQASARLTRPFVQEYSALLAAGAPHLLLDVREQHQFEIVALPHAVNLPLKELRRDTGRVRELRRGADGTELPVFVMCRRGILSQLAAQVSPRRSGASRWRRMLTLGAAAVAARGRGGGREARGGRP